MNHIERYILVETITRQASVPNLWRTFWQTCCGQLSLFLSYSKLRNAIQQEMTLALAKKQRLLENERTPYQESTRSIVG